MEKQEKFQVRHDTRAEKFYIDLEGKEAILTYTQVNDVMDLYMIFIPKSFRGQGFSKKIVRTAFEYAKKKGYKIIPTCPFIKEKFLKEHPEYKDMVTEKFF